MPRWKPPTKLLVPSEYEDAAAGGAWPATFEYTGTLPDGTLTLAYVYSLPPDAAGVRGELVTVHEFDATGRHRSVQTQRPAAGADAVLHAMFAPYRTAGWRPGNILVRPFLVEAEGVEHGFVLPDLGPGNEYETDCGKGDVFFLPFGFPFHPPFTDGSYST